MCISGLHFLETCNVSQTYLAMEYKYLFKKEMHTNAL